MNSISVTLNDYLECRRFNFELFKLQKNYAKVSKKKFLL